MGSANGTVLLRIKDRVAKQGIFGSVAYYLGTGLLERSGISIMRVYCAPPGAVAEPDIGEGAVLQSMQDLTPTDVQDLIAYRSEALVHSFARNFSRGFWCVVTRIDAHIGCVCWLTRVARYPPAANGAAAVIQYCFTVPQHRGKSLYPITLHRTRNAAGSFFGAPSPIFIESSVFNQSSVRGILKAGFEPVGTTLTVRKRAFFRRG